MFDLRYHVISLAAVFLALILGILVGVAISDPDLADRSELELQRDEIARLEEELAAAGDRSAQRDAAEQFVEASYGAVMHDRLAGKRIAVVFVGSVDQTLQSAVDRALGDAGADVVRMRALSVPLGEDAVEAQLEGSSELAGYRGEEHLPDLGRDLGRELVEGGETPLYDALDDELVEQRRGSARQEADAVVVVRTAKPQTGATGRFLLGLYDGLAAAAATVGAEASTADPSAVPVFRRAGLSSADAVDTRLGKVALAVLLEGGARGHYGLKEGADGVLPPIAPVERETEAGG